MRPQKDLSVMNTSLVDGRKTDTYQAGKTTRGSSPFRAWSHEVPLGSKNGAVTTRHRTQTEILLPPPMSESKPFEDATSSEFALRDAEHLRRIDEAAMRT